MRLNPDYWSDDPIQEVGPIDLPASISEDVVFDRYFWSLTICESGSGRTLKAEGGGGTALDRTRLAFRRQMAEDFGLECADPKERG